MSPVVLIQGAIRMQPEAPAPPAPRPERKSIVPAPMPGNSCPPEVDVSVGEGRSGASNGSGRGKAVRERTGMSRGQQVRKQTLKRILKVRVDPVYVVLGPYLYYHCRWRNGGGLGKSKPRETTS